MSHSPDLDSFKHRVSHKVDQQLKSILTPAHKSRLIDAMNYAVLGGGKRVRPLLCFASAELVQPNALESQAVLSAACAVELIHAYSLVHDDLPAMDDDDLRRGRPTTHKQFDEATAILAGDALQTLAFEVLSEASGMSADALIKSIRLLAEASGHAGMAGGQMVDLQAVGKQLDIHELTQMHSMKTGALIKSSVLLGAVAAGCDNEETLAALSAYAMKIGLAFQIQDDILDHTASTETLGKKQGADAELGKATYVALLGLERAKEKLQLAHSEAIQALDAIYTQGNSQDKPLLLQIADYIVARTH